MQKSLLWKRTSWQELSLTTDCVFFISCEHTSSTVVSQGKGFAVLVSTETTPSTWFLGKAHFSTAQTKMTLAASSLLPAHSWAVSPLESGSDFCQALDFEGKGIKSLKHISVVTGENVLPFSYLLFLSTCPYTWRTPASFLENHCGITGKPSKILTYFGASWKA